MLDEKKIQILGWTATFTAILMYVSYIPQIFENLNGNQGHFAQPLAAAINCLLWVIYGLNRKDYPLAVANMPGVIFGAITFVTAII